MAIRTALHLELTQRCNFNCSFCRSVRNQNNALLDYDLAVKCLEKLQNQRINGVYMNTVQLNGSGEALLYPRLEEMIREVRKRFPMAEFVTNGSLLTKERIGGVLNSGVDMIEISLTGIVPEVYQYFQGSGISYDRCVKQLDNVISNVHLLIKMRDEMEKNTYIRLRYIRSKELGSEQHLKDYIKYWKNSGVDEIFITALWDFRRAVPSTKRGKFKIIRCHAMNALMKIQADGTVYSCTCNLDVNRYGHGNVYETAIEKIVNSCEFIEERANKNTVDLDRVPKTCLSCENRAYRKLSFELQNMRGRIFLKKKWKNIFYRFFGIADILYERLERNDLFHKLFWSYMCRQSKKIHDDFQKKGLRTEGERR